jgi:hypothetical protein
VEQVQPLSMESARQSRGVSSYTELRDSVDGEAGTAWRTADKEAENYQQFIEGLRRDNRFSDEHKASEAWRRYLKSREVVESNRQKAKEKLSQNAATARRFSIPMPKETALHASSDQAVIAAQNEASRIVRQVDRSKSQPGPFKADPVETLRSEYGRGLGIGGVQGAAICRGVLSASEELGVGTESVVGPHREKRHLDSLERAENFERMSFSIGGSLREPPFKKPNDIAPQSFQDIFSKDKRAIGPRAPKKRQWK